MVAIPCQMELVCRLLEVSAFQSDWLLVQMRIQVAVVLAFVAFYYKAGSMKLISSSHELVYGVPLTLMLPIKIG